MKKLLVVGVVVLGIVVGLCGGAAGEVSTTGYPITDLGRGVAKDINKRNQVVGTLATAGGDNHAFVWQDNVMRDLDLRVGGTSLAHGINYSGQVVGGWASGTNMEACLWQPGGDRIPLGKLREGDTWSFAHDINTSGQVVGFSGSGDWVIDKYNFWFVPGSTYHAFLWDSINGMQELTNMAALPWSIASGINDAGKVVGQMPFGTDLWRGFLWEDNGASITDLGSYNGTASGACDINDHRQIAGGTSYPGGSAAFLWENGTQYIMPEGGNAAAYGINNEGAVVGLYAGSSPDSHAYVGGVHNGQGYVSDLGTFLGDGTRWINYGTYAEAINDLGIAVGSAERNGIQHATLWEPVPEPSSLLALGSGLAGLGGVFFRRRRR